MQLNNPQKVILLTEVNSKKNSKKKFWSFSRTQRDQNMRKINSNGQLSLSFFHVVHNIVYDNEIFVIDIQLFSVVLIFSRNNRQSKSNSIIVFT
jgi:hypothetical protein